VVGATFWIGSNILYRRMGGWRYSVQSFAIIEHAEASGPAGSTLAHSKIKTHCGRVPGHHELLAEHGGSKSAARPVRICTPYPLCIRETGARCPLQVLFHSVVRTDVIPEGV